MPKPSLAFPRTPKRKKGKVSQRKTLVAKLDKLCSQVVRERDGYRCVTCGKTREQGALIDAGHYVSRRCLKLRWDIRNVHAQCAYCNRFNAGAGAAYAAFILQTYGAQELERLDADSRLTWKPTLEELRELLAHFQSKLSAMTAQEELRA